jgi:hypothetical protein
MALELPKLTKKDGKGAASAPKVDVTLKVMEFFDKNPFMKILIPVVLFLILCAVFLFIIFGDGVILDDTKTQSDSSASAGQVEVVPGNNIITDKTVVKLIETDPLSGDILATAEYKGCVKGSSGLKTGLIHIGTQRDTLVLSMGETVGDSKWEVVELTNDYIVFKAGEITKKIETK